MPYKIRPVLWASLWGMFFIVTDAAVAQELSAPVCEVVIYDEKTELEEFTLDVDLARSNFSAYQKIFKMIEGLWEGKAIPRMDYIKAKYDLDAAKLDLEKAALVLERQGALVDQFRLICDDRGTDRDSLERAIQKAYMRYRRADCDALAKGIEVAATNLEFNREYLEQILKLRRENFATNTQVVLAELDVELEEKRLADARNRAAACQAELDDLE